MITHTYFICDEHKEPDRYASIIKQINELKLTNYSFFTHIWGTEITPEIYKKWVKTDTSMKFHGRNMITNPLKNADVSLVLNHIECLKNIRKYYTSGYFCIFESDVLFRSTYNNDLENVLEMAREKNDIDIINIGFGVGTQYPTNEPIKNSLSLYKEKINRCTEGVIWTYSGICNFLNYFDKRSDVDGPIDTILDVYSEYIGGFNIYWAHPSLVYQGSVTGMFKSHVR